MSLCLLIDDAGGLFDANGREVRSRLGCEGTTLHVVDHAIHQHGWIALVHHATRIEIYLRRHHAAPRAVQLAIDLVMATLAGQVVLVVDGMGGHREVFTSPAAAILRIEELIVPASSSDSAVLFRATQREIQDLWRDGNRALIIALQQFQTRLGVIDIESARQLSRMRAMGTTSVFERRRRSRNLVIRAVSPFVRFYEPNGTSRFEGHDIREQPNREYCDWVSATYSRALNEEQILVDDVDAVVRRPDGSPLMMSYRRLIAPYRAAGGSRLVVTTTELIPLPRRAGNSVG